MGSVEKVVDVPRVTTFHRTTSFHLPTTRRDTLSRRMSKYNSDEEFPTIYSARETPYVPTDCRRCLLTTVSHHHRRATSAGVRVLATESRIRRVEAGVGRGGAWLARTRPDHRASCHRPPPHPSRRSRGAVSCSASPPTPARGCARRLGHLGARGNAAGQRAAPRHRSWTQPSSPCSLKFRRSSVANDGSDLASGCQRRQTIRKRRGSSSCSTARPVTLHRSHCRTRHPPRRCSPSPPHNRPRASAPAPRSPAAPPTRLRQRCSCAPCPRAH